MTTSSTPADAGTTDTTGARSAAGFDLTPPDAAQRRAIAADLTVEERRVLLTHGTEAAFCGIFNAHKAAGTYTCRQCGLPLFRSDAKFESGTGWPSFFTPFDARHVAFVRDTSYGMTRVEIRCARCDGHLGHVFPDGPPPTHERYCLNSVSLAFTEDGTALPDRMGRGAPEGVPLGNAPLGDAPVAA